MRRLFFLIVIIVMALAFSSQSIAIQYTILKPEDGTPAGTFCISISKLGAYDVVDTSFGQESSIDGYVWIAPIKNSLNKVLYQYYYSNGVVKVEIVTNLKDEDQVLCAEVVDAKIGDTLNGISGIIYELQEQAILTEKQIEYLADQDIVVVGEWVPVDEDSDSGGSEGTSSIGASTLGPYYVIECGVIYEYYIGYVPPPPPITEVDEAIDGGWIVIYFGPNRPAELK